MSENQAGARRRKRRKTAQGNAKLGGLVALAARIPLRAAGGAFGFAQKNARLTFGIGALGVVCLLASQGVTSLLRRSQVSIPQEIKVFAPTSALREAVEKSAAEALQKARAHKETREEFLARLEARLSKMDAIDSFALRAGLDKTLQVKVESQVPLFVLEGQGKERVLVGHRMRLLQRKLAPGEHPHLLRISTPELKLTHAFPALLDGAKARKAAPLNFAWLAQQGARIRAASQQQGNTWVPGEISWRSQGGFAIDARLPQDGGRTVVVVLGESDLDKKMARLPEILESLKGRGLAPATIDLNYGDKALIRLSESAGAAAPL